MSDIENRRENKNEVRIYDDKINDVAKRISDKMEIPIEIAKTELGIGIINALMLNKHRQQYRYYEHE